MPTRSPRISRTGACLLGCAATLAACASVRDDGPKGQTTAAQAECSRLESATRLWFFDAANPLKMQRRTVEDCGKGDVRACVAAPVAIPFTALVAIIGAPVILPLALGADDSALRRHCSTTLD